MVLEFGRSRHVHGLAAVDARVHFRKRTRLVRALSEHPAPDYHHAVYRPTKSPHAQSDRRANSLGPADDDDHDDHDGGLVLPCPGRPVYLFHHLLDLVADRTLPDQEVHPSNRVGRFARRHRQRNSLGSFQHRTRQASGTAHRTEVRQAQAQEHQAT